MVIPVELQKLYPFRQNIYKTSDNLKMNYVDEGEGPPVLMVHGNPTWSFFYRNLIKRFASSCRVIAPDHIGCGLSDKPEKYPYILKKHIDNLKGLIDHLNLQEITLIVHDWGGAIGMGTAVDNPGNFKKIVILNTAAFTFDFIPRRIDILRNAFPGEFLIRRFNLFAKAATFMAVTQKMSPATKKGFLLPYNNFQNRIATARFVRDIPMKEEHRSYPLLLEIERKLGDLKCPKIILWGARDFCFNQRFLKKWREIYPDTPSFVFEKAGHYLLEDALPEIMERLAPFIEEDK